ncbi:MAG: HlyD family efflux transporter periplasmic adaptor subunit [Chloroflexi bacterium]|nr:HlyD family efflux transporter periplasmic adaptor subunit [Chloroflexota bacterium]
MNKGLVYLIVVVVIAAAAVLFFTLGGAQALAAALNPPEPTPAVMGMDQTTLPVVTDNEINVAGRVVPAQYMDLSFNSAGVVAEVLVVEGQAVKKGEIIARLRDEEKMALSVSEARLAVMNAEKAIEDLKRQAPLLAAQAAYDITQTKEKLDKAQRTRRAMDYPKATQKQIDDAYKDYKAAEEVLKMVEQYANSENKEMRDAYNAAKKERDTLLSRYNWLLSQYTTLEIAEADAQVMLLEAELQDQQRKYEIYSQGPDPLEMSIAESQLELAKAQLRVAEAAYADLVITAPFDGAVVDIKMHSGDYVTPGQAVALIADFSKWHIETEDLTELSVTRIREGARAEVHFDALPEETFNGVVIDIKQIGENRQGDITYTAVIELEKADPRLRWNMTSPVVIKTD